MVEVVGVEVLGEVVHDDGAVAVAYPAAASSNPRSGSSQADSASRPSLERTAESVCSPNLSASKSHLHQICRHVYTILIL